MLCRGGEGQESRAGIVKRKRKKLSNRGFALLVMDCVLFGGFLIWMAYDFGYHVLAGAK